MPREKRRFALGRTRQRGPRPHWPMRETYVVWVTSYPECIPFSPTPPAPSRLRARGSLAKKHSRAWEASTAATNHRSSQCAALAYRPSASPSQERLRCPFCKPPACPPSYDYPKTLSEAATALLAPLHTPPSTSECFVTRSFLEYISHSPHY